MKARHLAHAIGRDVSFGLRSLRRTPGFTAIACLALALGIGATTTIFSVVDGVLLRPLPYREPDRLVVVLHGGTDPVAPANFIDWRSQARSFEGMGAADLWGPNLSGVDRAEQIEALRVTPDLISLLGVEPLLGRAFLPEEGEVGRDHEVVLSYRLWQRRFGADRAVIGRSIRLDGEVYSVVGVMPRSFRFAPFWATRAELWAPLALAPRLGSRQGNSLRIFARLAGQTTLAQARSEIATITGRLEREFPGTNQDVQVVPLTERVVGNVRPALRVLLVAVSLVLLIACANVAHMLLARSAGRSREIALRTALGASRGRLITQLLTESLLLALSGGVLGLMVALLGVQAVRILGPRDLPGIAGVGIDVRVAVFALIATLVTGVGFGLAPAIEATGSDLGQTLKEGDRGGTDGRRRQRFRAILIGSEFALALVLLVGAGLSIRSFAALQSVDPGLDPRGVLSMVVPVAGSAVAAPERRASFYRELLARVRALPGVSAAGGINHLPLAGDVWGTAYFPDGKPAPKPGEEPRATFRAIYPGYLRTMGIRLVSGRDIAESDVLGSAPVLLVNEAMVRREWPGADPLGKRIRRSEHDSVRYTVVGVVANVVRAEWTAAAAPEMYVAFAQSQAHLENPSGAFAYLTLVVRSKADPAALEAPIRAIVASLDRDVPVSAVQTMAQVVARAHADPRFYLVFLGSFAAVALLLAAVGIYGVMSYVVSRRTQEIGIRMTLGATRGDVARLVVGQGLRVALAGTGVGLVGALVLTRLMTSLLYGVRPTDPITFAVVAIVLALVAVAACYIPAARAARIDPVVAVRQR